MAKRRREPYSKFKCWMKENGVKSVDIGKLIGKAAPGVSQRLNGTGPDFDVREIRIICQHYGISADEYFIAYKVSQKQQTA